MPAVNQFNGFGGTPADLVTANGQISNANQTQTLLNTMGKWVANPAATA